MDTYEYTKTNQYGIDLEKFIHSVCHLQGNYKKGIMESVETKKLGLPLLLRPISIKHGVHRGIHGAFKIKGYSY